MKVTAALTCTMPDVVDQHISQRLPGVAGVTDETSDSIANTNKLGARGRGIIEKVQYNIRLKTEAIGRLQEHVSIAPFG